MYLPYAHFRTRRMLYGLAQKSGVALSPSDASAENMLTRMQAAIAAREKADEEANAAAQAAREAETRRVPIEPECWPVCPRSTYEEVTPGPAQPVQTLTPPPQSVSSGENVQQQSGAGKLLLTLATLLFLGR